MNDIRPRRFEAIPPVIKNLLIANVLAFIAQKTFGESTSFSIDNMFALHAVQSVYFKPHQLVTYLFLHGGFTHIFFNMFALWMFGSTLENYWGSKRFLIFYMACGIGAGIFHLIVLWREMAPVMEAIQQYPPLEQEQFLTSPGSPINGATMGASGAVFGCLAAFGYLFPNTPMIILPIPIPIKAKWLVLLYAGMELYLGIQNSAGDNVAHWAHLGGAVVGILMVMYWKKHDRRNFY
ncbi:MAG: rhomboid family intramembrane serine protease [Chitinophagales bacterium]